MPKFNILWVFIILISIISLIVISGLVWYTCLFINWKYSIDCNEVKEGYAFNSPLIMPEEMKGEATRCYTFTIGGSSNVPKLFENGNYLGYKFGCYEWNLFSYPIPCK